MSTDPKSLPHSISTDDTFLFYSKNNYSSTTTIGKLDQLLYILITQLHWQLKSNKNKSYNEANLQKTFFTGSITENKLRIKISKKGKMMAYNQEPGLTAPLKKVNIIFKLFFLFILLTGSGCSLMPSHIHSPESLAAAEKVQNELNTYAENAPAMYKAMINNLDKFQAEENRVINDLIINQEAALINQLPNLSIDEFKEKKGKLVDDTGELEKKLLEGINKYLINREIIKKELEDANAAIKKTQAVVNSAKTNVTNWNASIAVLKQGIAGLLSANDAENPQNQSKNTPSVDDVLKNIGEKEIEFFDSDGKLTKKKITKILEDQLPTSKKDLEDLDIPDAPGSTLIILKMGLELAEIEKAAAESKLAQLSSRVELFEDMYGGVQLSKQFLDDIREFDKNIETVESKLMELTFDARTQHSRLKEFKTSDSRTWKNAVGELMTKRNNIEKILINSRNLFIADLILTRARNLYELTMAGIDHKESILSSQIEDRRYLAMLKSISDSLVVFHRGGFSRQDATDIINIAQAIAIAVLAGRI